MENIMCDDCRNSVKVTIVCMAYNHEKHIRRTLEGFVNQKTNFNFEVLIHDDASSDTTAEIIREYEMKYPQLIKAIYQSENQYSKGAGTIETYLFPLLSGEFIAICEGDDYWCDNSKLQIQYDYMCAHPGCSICVHNAYQEMSNTGTRCVHNGNAKTRDYTPEEIILGGGSQFATCSVFVRKDVYINMPDCFNLDGVGDYQLFMYASFCGKFHYMDRIMSSYTYNSGPDSWTNRIWSDSEKRKKHFFAEIEMLKRVDEFFKYKYHKAIVKKIKQICFSISIWERNYRCIIAPKYWRFWMDYLYGIVRMNAGKARYFLRGENMQ